MEFLQTQFAANSLLTWLIALGISIAVILIIGILKCILLKQLRRMAKQYEQVTLWPVLLEVVSKTKWLFLLIVALMLGSLPIWFALPGD